MKAFRRFSLTTLIGSCLLLTSCIDSKEPICKPEDAKVDKDLTGTWRTELDNGEIHYFHIAPAGGNLPAGVMRIITIVFSSDGTLSQPGEMLGFSADVGDRRFLNIAFIDDGELGTMANEGWNPELPKGFLLVKYQAADGKLTIWEMDAQAKRRLIEAEKIKGTIEKNAVFFTDTPENIVAVLSGPEGDKLFTKTPTVYKRD
jgi:hypothetical protein